MATKSKIPSAAMQKRIMKTGEVTDADVEQYIKQVGIDTLQGMNLTPENMKEYLKNITELGNKPKKKLPSKNKISKGDSMLVVDGNETVSKVKPDIDSSERVSFKTTTKKATEGSLDLGTAAFNKIFPNIGKFMGFVKNKFENQTKTATETNASILSYSREVEHSSDLLDNIVQSGERTNLILNRILAAASSSNRQSPAQPTPGPATGNQPGSNQQVDTTRNNRPSSNTPPSPPASATTPRPSAVSNKPADSNIVRNAAIGAGVTTAAVVGTGAVLASRSNSGTPTATATNAAPITPAAGRTAEAAAEAERARTEQLNASALQYQTSVQERERIARERAAFEETFGQADTERTISPEAGARVRFTPYQARAYSNPEAQSRYQELQQQQSTIERQEREALQNATAGVSGAARDRTMSDRDLTPGMIRALTTRYGYTTEQLQQFNGGATEQHSVTINGIPYSPAVRTLFDQELKKELERRAKGEDPAPAATNVTAATAAPPTAPTETSQAAAPVIPAAVPVPVAQPRQSTTTVPNNAAVAVASPVQTPTAGFDSRLLHIKAKKIIFKADKFEYSGDSQTPAMATSIPTPMGGGGGGSAPSAAPPGSPPPAPAATSQPAAATSGGAAQTGAANLSGLDFAGGVDQRIKADVAEKTKSVQSAFGKKLTVTSGFRDAGRNTRAGGAEGSKHLTGDAVDVQFSGNEQDTINLIKVASEKGMGGIGVYRPGFLHLDTGSKRVWGPDYKAGSIPQWAKPALDEHMGKPAAAASAGAAAPAATPAASPPSPTSGSAPASAPSTSGGSPSPSPTAAAMPSTPSSGAAVSKASTADEAAARTPAPVPTQAQNPSTPSSAPSAGVSAIDPNNPGELEPPDAASRYSRLFNMVA